MENQIVCECSQEELKRRMNSIRAVVRAVKFGPYNRVFYAGRLKPNVKFGIHCQTNIYELELPKWTITQAEWDRPLVLGLMTHELGHILFTPFGHFHEMWSSIFCELAEYLGLKDESNLHGAVFNMIKDVINIFEDVKVDYLSSTAFPTGQILTAHCWEKLMQDLNKDFESLIQSKTDLAILCMWFLTMCDLRSFERMDLPQTQRELFGTMKIVHEKFNKIICAEYSKAEIKKLKKLADKYLAKVFNITIDSTGQDYNVLDKVHNLDSLQKSCISFLKIFLSHQLNQDQDQNANSANSEANSDQDNSSTQSQEKADSTTQAENETQSTNSASKNHSDASEDNATSSAQSSGNSDSEVNDDANSNVQGQDKANADAKAENDAQSTKGANDANSEANADAEAISCATGEGVGSKTQEQDLIDLIQEKIADPYNSKRTFFTKEEDLRRDFLEKNFIPEDRGLDDSAEINLNLSGYAQDQSGQFGDPRDVKTVRKEDLSQLSQEFNKNRIGELFKELKESFKAAPINKDGARDQELNFNYWMNRVSNFDAHSIKGSLIKALRTTTLKDFNKRSKYGFKLNSRKLQQIATGQNVAKPFIKRGQSLALSTEIAFCVDLSGSMSDDISTQGLADTLDLLIKGFSKVTTDKVKLSVFSFADRILKLKSAKEKLSYSLFSKLRQPGGGTCGWEALKFAASDLLKSNAERKIIVCLTDGDFCLSNRFDISLLSNLGIETYGIAYGFSMSEDKINQACGRIAEFDSWISVLDRTQLPFVMEKLLEELLQKAVLKRS